LNQIEEPLVKVRHAQSPSATKERDVNAALD
jgi:hypothetical protein